MTTPLLHQPPQDGLKPEPNDLTLWSVTTVIGVLEKPALLYWAAEETAKCAILQEKVWRALLHERSEDEAVEWLRDARFRPDKDRLSATALGTLVHDCCEQYALSGVRPDAEWIAHRAKSSNPKLSPHAAQYAAEEAAPFLDRFDEWLDEFQPPYQATEVTVYDPTYGYAGTCDGFLTIDGVRFIFDLKTSRTSFDKRGKERGPYPEVALQLAGYRFAKMAAVWRPRRTERYRRRYYLLSPDEQAAAVPVPEVDGGLVIHISPDHCTAYPVRCDEAVYEAFLFVLEAARWQFEMAKNVIGAPLEPPVRQVAS